ncbi:MAG: DUF4389 domain-containing protein [Bacteroidota bacterium]|nr:DUF4389 domain-containing protein [Bacteroidota bacterium]MDP4232471.1 DUF4389 domain-containing protein [Bacteroidota bacterium]MDP4241607.1 DUF4389 domain-containing protein [Bacteroidota bacterium]MDP4286351.1 DUF4389 domain-containing protein [Bacteroidota bacterium]
MSTTAFPATLTIDYPDRPLDRLSTFFRPLLAIPIVILLALIAGPLTHSPWPTALGAGGVLFVPTVLMLLFRKKYPRWWYDWNLALVNFSTRCAAYLALLSDEYPSTDQEQEVHIAISYPNVELDLSPGMPLIKWFLAIPHYIVLWALGIAAVVCVIIAWFAILFTGRYPKSLFNFVTGVFRWSLRVSAYAFLLTTDQYPPFSIE